MDVTYGADYSAGELSPAELDQFGQYDIRFLIRYIGWPDNPKCISHYPGRYHALVSSGRMVLLVAELDGMDAAGGYDGGVAMARRALADARSIGYPDSLPGFVPGVTDPSSAWADGIYGEHTRQAVLRFQASADLSQTGEIRPDDWARLLS
jgi:peptidoglycan hydrolase-like protein with peptidoglycan-binding domain